LEIVKNRAAKFAIFLENSSFQQIEPFQCISLFLFNAEHHLTILNAHRDNWL
jgi:hypothetical protein